MQTDGVSSTDSGLFVVSSSHGSTQLEHPSQNKRGVILVDPRLTAS